MVSPAKKQEIVDALRRGTVPSSSLDALAVGLAPFETALDQEINLVRTGGSVFKALRGEYGSGKTFFARWLAERARKLGLVSSEVQVSETETPLHRMETVYRRLIEHLATAETPRGAFRSIVDGWLYTIEQDVLSAGGVDAADGNTLLKKTDELLEKRLSGVGKQAPAFSIALRGYRRAIAAERFDLADGILAWLAGQPQIGAEAKRFAGVRGDLDNDGASGFLQGLLLILRDAGHPGLLLVLDEVETLQRVRTDMRDKGLNALRQLIDDVHAGRFPGLYLLVTGTPAFFDGPQGVQRLAPLAQRLHVDFSGNSRFDNARAIQIRLQGFTLESLGEVGRKVRDIFAEHSPNRVRLLEKGDDDYISILASAVAGEFAGKVGVAPRIFLKKLVDVLDRIDQFPDFDPRRDYALTLAPRELTPVERATRAGKTVDDIELDL